MAGQPRLGEILVAAGLITQDDLARALEYQRQQGGRLGDALVALKLANEEDIYQTLAEQLGLRYATAMELPLDRDVCKRYSEAAARQQGALPVARAQEGILLAMVDPHNQVALDDVAFLYGVPAVPVIVTPQTFETLVRRAFHTPSARLPASGGAAAVAAPPEADAGPVAALVEDIIRRALEENASDVHIEPLAEHVRVRYRLDGVLHEMMQLPRTVQNAVLSRIKILGGMDIAEQRRPQDGRYQYVGGGQRVDLRLATLPTMHGEKVEMRLLVAESRPQSLADLGFGEDDLLRYQAIIAHPYGMILVTGPTGSGKTTTLAATLHALNDPGRNICTLEDPVEYEVPGVNQVSLNVKAGLTFASGLRALLRQDPDVIMVGEVRDQETAEIAVRAALTGHLVLSTMHTNDAPGSVARLVDMGVERYLVAASLVGVVAQRLARRLCTRCRRRVPLTPEDAALLGWENPPQTVYEASGCVHCHRTGYRGRVGLVEVMTVDAGVREAIVAGQRTSQLRELAMAAGMRPLVVDGQRKIAAGLTSVSEVRRVAYMEG